MARALSELGDLTIVAPATEQSGVGHSITYLTPLVVKEIHRGEELFGYAVEGSPADCVKLAVSEFCPQRPDLVVSGINGGLNAGINVLYSGTVAAAIEGAFFGIDSIAVSLEYDEYAKFDEAAAMARGVIQQILERKKPQSQLYNLNIPTAALEKKTDLRVVPMGVARYGENFIQRLDPKGRRYYWATNDPPPQHSEVETDISALAEGYVTLTALQYDLTQVSELAEMRNWDLQLP